MKSFAAVSATILAIAASASAELGFALGPLTVQTLTESKTARTDFSVRDLDYGGSTTCSTAWVIGELDKPSLWYKCSDTSFQFRFPAGIANFESYNLQISRTTEAGTVIGEANLNSHGVDPAYVCQSPGETPGTDTECKVVRGGVVASPI
ncbi:hypothetical protein ASPVEDRAFT_148566 [Aspergillus versicolor CBS 583.65]|uniref:AA1-like domain-containing protein n=1 Tax=Aspergillus versicolor CBS 583.65 TaxID=1036611 RepID=A0A1L9PDA2_ASPVE|nr:uncharacterized protein ASPVEDRAFT_148566 [Aspergillus versicolor CBS 583.65]OJI99500.1 hypothetical protein ASPVEDRAFT_148566 [Aspergillus versicolor CBS 583.65]